jgi:hypothetical protein
MMIGMIMWTIIVVLKWRQWKASQPQPGQAMSEAF